MVYVDLAPVKELLSLQRQCINNLDQIAVYLQANSVHQDEIAKLQRGYFKLWEQYSKLLEHIAKLVAL